MVPGEDLLIAAICGYLAGVVRSVAAGLGLGVVCVWKWSGRLWWWAVWKG